MIIEFSVKNYRSIKDLQTLSMVAAPIKSKYPELDENNVIKVSDKLSLIKSVAIYGANGSGKSNLVKALFTMMVFIQDSFKDNQIGKRIIIPFTLSNETPNQPTFFQLVFILDKVRYRYGFEVFQNEVKSEWLFGTPGKSETHYFIREGSSIKINEKKYSEGKGLEERTSKSNLFLNVTNAFNGSLSNQIIGYITNKISVNRGINDASFFEFTKDLLGLKTFKQNILSLMNYADFGIEDIKTKKRYVPEDVSHKLIGVVFDGTTEDTIFKRMIRNEDWEKIFEKEWIMDDNESEGTQKFFTYSGAIINSLEYGGTLILDEFDARLHPMLTKKIVEMFNSPTINKNGAQLVFVTHDTNLLDNSLLRRDQIYFTEKNKMQETVLYSLADFKGIRNDASYEKDYINGKYGAIPFLGDFEKLFEA
jgi:AAA15 family ATPase/GTPase